MNFSVIWKIKILIFVLFFLNLKIKINLKKIEISKNIKNYFLE